MRKKSETKAESFARLEDLSAREKRILEYLQSRPGGISRRILARELKLQINSITAPVLKLIKAGAVGEDGEIFDQETNRHVARLVAVKDGGGTL